MMWATALLGMVSNRIRGAIAWGGAINIILFGIHMGLVHQTAILVPFAMFGMWLGQQPGWGRYIGALGGWEDDALEEFKPVDFFIRPLRRRARGTQDVITGKFYYENPTFLRLWGFAGLGLRGLFWGLCIAISFSLAAAAGWIASHADWSWIFFWKLPLATILDVFHVAALNFSAWPLLAGLLMPVCYWATIEACRLLKTQNPNGDGWEWGEAVFGGVLWPFCIIKPVTWISII